MNTSILTVIVFCLVYLWLIVSRRGRAAAMWIGVALLFAVPPLFGRPPVLGPGDLFVLHEGSWASINWNVIGIFAGTLLVAEAFIYSRVPAVCADVLIDRSPNMGWAILGVCAFSGAISTVAENVATVLIVAPIAIALARKLKVSCAPFLIGIAVSSNLQGTATLIGDPPSMILAAYYKLNFNDFFWYGGRPGIFFAVQAGAVAGFAVLWLMFRRYRQPIARLEREKARSWVPTILLALMIGGLACASFVDPNFLWFGGAVCLGAAVVAMVWMAWRDRGSALAMLKSFDLETTLFLAGVFMLVYALGRTGLVETAARWAASVTGDSLLGAFLLIVGLSVAVSAFVDNVPYVAAMLPLVAALGKDLGLPAGNMLLPFGLLIGACLGGNVTPVGASANVVAYGMLNRPGEEGTSFLDFVRIGLPFTLASVAAGALFLWAAWMWF